MNFTCEIRFILQQEYQSGFGISISTSEEMPMRTRFFTISLAAALSLSSAVAANALPHFSNPMHLAPSPVADMFRSVQADPVSSTGEFKCSPVAAFTTALDSTSGAPDIFRQFALLN